MEFIRFYLFQKNLHDFYRTSASYQLIQFIILRYLYIFKRIFPFLLPIKAWNCEVSRIS